jgi:nucleotide-binding universal stress UspA family protein
MSLAGSGEEDGMKKPNRILCAVDFSEGSKKAVALAGTLANGAPLDLLHVWDVPQFLAPDALIAMPQDPRPVAQLAAEQGEASMKAFATQMSQNGVEIGTTRVAQGSTADCICTLAENGGYDLVVVGTHGRSGLNRLLLGSVAESVVRHSKVPVLSVRGYEEEKKQN